MFVHSTLIFASGRALNLWYKPIYPIKLWFKFKHFRLEKGATFVLAIPMGMDASETKWMHICI